jgi:hypothetical protein
MLMKITFSQIYSEPGASFDLPGPLLKAVREGLDDLGRNIDQLSAKVDREDFELVLIISASSKLDALEIKGPNIRRKTREIEFSLFVPWQETKSFEEKIDYILPKIGEGVIGVFKRYGVDITGVDNAIQMVLKQAKASPEKFQYRKKE